MKTSLKDMVSSSAALKAAWLQVKRGKEDKPGIIKFAGEDNGESSIQVLSQELRDGAYQCGSFDRVEVEKHGSFADTRTLSVPKVRDRVVQRAIFDRIAKILRSRMIPSISSLPEDKYALAKTQVCIAEVIKACKQRKIYYFESDIESFFDSIPKEKFLKMLFAALSDESLNEVIRDLAYFKYGNGEQPKAGVPQGSPLSPLFADFYLQEFDQAVRHHKGITAIRYVDDFVFFASDKSSLTNAEQDVRAVLKELKLSLSEKKTWGGTIPSRALKFLGLKFTSERIGSKYNFEEVKRRLVNDTLSARKYRTKGYKGEKIRSITRLQEIVNYRLDGWAKYLAPYHVSELLIQTQDFIDNLAKQRKYKFLRSGVRNIARHGDIKKVIPIENWQEIWQEKSKTA